MFGINRDRAASVHIHVLIESGVYARVHTAHGVVTAIMQLHRGVHRRVLICHTLRACHDCIRGVCLSTDRFQKLNV
jgi:hypothetical protein